MAYLIRRKELILIITTALLLGIADLDLISEQQENSRVLKSGKGINPATVNGRTSCEIPIPDITKRKKIQSFGFQ